MKVNDYLKQQGIAFQTDRHAATYTAQQLAHEEHVSGYMVAKPVIVKGAHEFAMCVLSAPDRVDLDLVAIAMAEDHVRLATENEMVKLFPDCELGAEPPVGSMFGLRTIMDPGLQEDAFLVMQAGTHTEAISMSRMDWERVSDPMVAPIAVI